MISAFHVVAEVHASNLQVFLLIALILLFAVGPVALTLYRVAPLWLRDLEQHNQMKKALQLSEARYRGIVEDQMELICRHQADGTITFVNEAYCRYFGLTQESAVGSHFDPVILEAERDQVTQILNSLSVETPTATSENRVISQGEVRWTQWNNRAIFDEHGCFIEFQTVGRDITERKQAEAALQASETRFRQLAEAVQEGFFVYEINSAHYSYVNSAYKAIIGVSPDPSHLKMSYWLNNIHPDDRARIEAGLQQERAGGDFSDEYRYIHPDGNIRWLRSQAFPIRGDTGVIVRIVGTVEDITHRKQTENALQEREALLRAIGDNLPKGVLYQLVHDPKKGFYFSYISAGIERLIGVKPEDVLQNPDMLHNLVVDADRSILEQLTQVSLNNLSIFEMQMRKRTRSGNIQWSSVRSVPRRLNDGRTVWDGVEVDITDLKHIEEALRTSEEQFRKAFDDAPIGVSLVSVTGQFVKANPRYCEIVGYSEEELVKLTFQDITHPADVEADVEGLRQMLMGEIRTFQTEKRYITKQGTVVPVLMNAAVIRDQNGQVVYFVGHIQDIRDRLKIEQMKDEFISVVSHELRTPLTSIRGALGILETGVFCDRPDKAQHMLQIAINNSERLVRLVDEILSLERLQSGKVQLVMEECQVAELMQQAVDSVQAIADQATITLSITPLSATVWAAPDTIIQALTNLLSNAIKFSSPEGTVWLKAEEWESERVGEWKNAKSHSLIHPSTHSPVTHHPSPYILFSVTDQGRGIPADKLTVIFEQFQQVDVSDSRKKGGTGLGLAICKSIVQQHRGKIWVESTLGKGSTFYFTLPLMKGDGD